MTLAMRTLWVVNDPLCSNRHGRSNKANLHPLKSYKGLGPKIKKNRSRDPGGVARVT